MKRGILLHRTRRTTHVVFGQKPRAELKIVFDVERAAGLKLHPECGERNGFAKLLHAADSTELLLRILGNGHARGSSVAAAVVVVRRRCRVCGVGIVVVV